MKEGKNITEETRKDLKFSGNMTVPGGLYKRVNVNGNMTIDGDLDCMDIRVNGNMYENGTLKTKTSWVNGFASLEGDLKAVEIDLNGEVRIDGDMAVDQIKAKGKLGVKGGITSDKLDVFGVLNVRGDCEAETFACKGALDIEGTLNAGNIEVRLYGPSRVKEIGGEKIDIRRSGDSKLKAIMVAIFTTLSFHRANLTVETLEGDEIILEHVTAKVVRGNSVTIGDGCEIDLVEYRTDFKKAAGASVLKHEKI